MNIGLKKIPKKPDYKTFELLTRAKLLLDHAISHANCASSIDRMIAIHELDNSIEYLLKIIILSLDIESITGKNFENCTLKELAGEVNKFLSDHHKINLPYLSEIKMIRQIRNLVQHCVIDPKPDIERFSRITERLFDKVFINIFDISREELKISSLINNDELKAHLKSAEKYIDEKDFLLSIVSSRDAFENALFLQLKNSEIKLSSIPALVELNKSSNKSYQFFEKITDIIEMLRLNINLKKYDRFFEYMKHIPSKYNVSKDEGYVIMQRQWNREDAMFCYGFVSETIIKWQEEELEPIYITDLIDKYIFEKKIGDVILSENSYGYSCSFLYALGQPIVDLIYVDKFVKEKIDKLISEKDYLYLEKIYKNGKLETIIEYKIKLLNINKKLITNNPERWEITLWYNQIPLTWYRKDYKDDKVINETPCINTANENELRSIYEDLITEKIAKKIVSLRKAIGKICHIEDLKKIDGITNEQIMWLASFTRK